MLHIGWLRRLFLSYAMNNKKDMNDVKRQLGIRKMLKYYGSLPVQVKASVWFLVCAFLQKGISVLMTPIFTRLLSAEQYGQYNVFNSWFSVAIIVVSLNLSCAVYTQGLIKYTDDRKQFSSSLQGLTTVLIALWCGLYVIFQDFWNNFLEMTTTQVISMLLLVWTTSIFNFWSSEQRVAYKYKALVIITLITAILKPAIGICFVIKSEDKVTARILSIVFVEVLICSGMYIRHMRDGKKFCCKKYWREALALNLPLIPHYLSQTVLNSSDRIMIERMVGASQAGVYSLAYSIALIMTLFNTALMQTMTPWIYQKIKEKKGSDIAPVAYVSLIGIAAINLLLIALAPEAVAIFSPKEYYDAIWVIPPVAMSVFFMYSYDLFAKFAFYYEKTVLIMLGSVVGATLNVALNYVFIEKFGYRAAGYTTLVCYVIYTIGHYFSMNKVCDVYCDGIRPYSAKIILKITLTFMAVGFLFMFSYNYNAFRMALLVIMVCISICYRRKIYFSVKTMLNMKSSLSK